MVRENNNRDNENKDSVENNANTIGNGNKTYQAGGDIVEGNKSPDEGRVKTDVFTIVSELSTSLGRFFFKTGVGDRLERLATPTGAIASLFLLTIVGDSVHGTSDATGIMGAVLSASAYAYSQISSPLLGALADRLGIAIILALIVGLPIWYKIEKFSSTCSKCDRPFAAMTRTIEYPSRSTVDGEGNRYVPMDRDRFCIYCDGDIESNAENDASNGGESVPQIMADGGDGADAGACCCECHKED